MVFRIFILDNLKSIYSFLGPPQLSTMLSVTEPFENLLDTHEESSGKLQTQKSNSLNIQQKKGY